MKFDVTRVSILAIKNFGEQSHIETEYVKFRITLLRSFVYRGIG